MSETDREALVALYNATGGASWNNNRNWNTDADLSKWHGVQADGDGRVVSLRLCNNNMQGVFQMLLGTFERHDFYTQGLTMLLYILVDPFARYLAGTF
ncbi:unnamed protein product [Pylaiella littoralis]